ncbi:hypothetical protein PPYR_11135 [Photinus pyralis]|uniref:I/LWEQ domain-containing protein n=1 Tax=Photinus pyralis TaxID=7054 RepID=A0A5N4AAD7_PHOPY|nr:huntingtin-interacting protein 1 isoform X1 [Photinus pyralis]KAB0794296.1 hypothetical protein PPYR_11135 [Photinus pyralis]
MASLSLPRVLQPRKTSLEVERENFEKSQITAINKAINNLEIPVKQKHVRLAIIGTFHEQGAQTFWMAALRLPFMDDRIVAWKLCHVVHKVLREGHPLCLVHSQRHRKELDETGKLWCHLKEGYGKMIRLYTTLLMTKLDFHKRNPRFPGHLGVTNEELESIGANDINNYFQLSVEMFDYLDNILELQTAIFGSLDMSRSNSMTSAGQCRLAPLIMCIQDASRLYDYCVKILFRLHSSLPSDILIGHRDRFFKQFKELKQFYQNTNALQYFRNLITVPPLPERPPNFLMQAELRTYVTQEVVVPLEEDDPSEGNLVDTTDNATDHSDIPSQRSLSPAQFQQPQQVHIDAIAERDNLIKHLQYELERLRNDNNRLARDNVDAVNKLQEQVISLETTLATKDSELVQERQIKEDLFHQASAVAQSQDSEQKIKDEKFTKLLGVYKSLRNEHIDLLRQKPEIEKKVKDLTAKSDDAQQQIADLESKIRQMELDNSVRVEELQKASSDHTDELEGLRRDKDLFNMETEILKKSLEDATKAGAEYSIKLEAVMLEKENLVKDADELTNKIVSLQGEIEQARTENAASIEQIITQSLQECEIVLQHSVHELDNPALSAVTCSPDYFRSLTQDCIGALNGSIEANHSNPAVVIKVAIKIAHQLSTYTLQGRATSNTSPDITFGERMTDACKELGDSVLTVLGKLRMNLPVDDSVREAVEKVKAVASLAETISGSLRGENADKLADMIDDELSDMDKAIEEAARRIQEMLSASRAADSGIKLEVNEKILDSCTTLMQAIKILVQKARLLQAEIVSQGKGTASAKEFYKRNHRWTDGFISAAKAVAAAAKYFLSAADKVVNGQGKLEQLVVASQEIAASTAQLVVASRVKAERKSNNLQQLSQASKGVTTATGGVVATVKDCSQLMDEAEELDTSNMTLHQAKRLEMDSQVRVLELEKELEQERLRLSALRRHHYQLAGENE